MSAVLSGKSVLVYSEGDYEAFLDQRAHSTKSQLISYFTRPAYEQMEERFCAEHCSECDARVEEEEANSADSESRDPLCDRCKPEIWPHPDCCPRVVFRS